MQTRPPARTPDPSLPLLISGRDEAALRGLAARWSRWLAAHPETPFADVRRAAAARPHLEHRAVIEAADAPDAIAALDALAAGQPHPAVALDRAQPRAGLVYVFTGHGGHWPGMGRALLDEVPAFAEAVAACDAALRPHSGWSVIDALRDADQPADQIPFDVAQCTLFAMGYGLVAAFRAAGLEPDAVVGHSLGEMTAAVVAGAIPLDEGAHGVWSAAHLITEAADPGGMLFVALPLARVEALIAELPGLAIGTVDGPGSTVVSGDPEPLAALEATLARQGIFHRRVKVDGAMHSHRVDPLVPALRASLARLTPRTARIPMVSSITGGAVDGAELDHDYWCGNMRSTVRFDRAMRVLLADGLDTFVELGPHPLLTTGMTALCADEGLPGVAVLGAMRRNEGTRGLHRALGALHACGHRVQWSRLFGPGPAVALPAPGLPQATPPEPTPAPAEAGLAELPFAARLARIEAIARDELAAVLGLDDPETLAADARIEALGLDSLKVLDLKNRIARRVGLRLPQQFLYDHPTPAGAARALAERFGAAPKPPRLAACLADEPAFEARVAHILPPLRTQVCQALGRETVDDDASLRALGIDDVLGAELCLRIQRETGLRVFPREVVERDTLRDLAAHLAAAYGPYRPATPTPLDALDARITSPYHPWPEDAPVEPSDQPLVFILSPPRSGSTLLRVMLAGHSRLFSPQELHLAPFETMADYDAALHGTVLDMGLVGTIAEVISRTGSWNLYRQWVREARPTAEIYDFFRARIGDRTLVDKSPLFFPPLAALRRMARAWPNARFVHLVRHPVSCVGSYVAERFQGIFEQTADLDPYDAAEWCWTRVHAGIEAFAAELPAGRITRLHFEDLARDPEQAMRRLCPALGVDFEPAVLEPYTGHRMVAGGFQVGDPNFTRHRRIVADKADAWRDVALPRPLQGPTLDVARRLGYDTAPLGADGPPRLAAPRTDAALGGIGLEGDIHLPEDIRPTAPDAPVDPRTILLTGATGFLGAFLLDELLTRTDARILCLVRAKDPAHGLDRIRRNLTGYGIWRPDLAARIEVIPGDLGLPDMGLSEPARIELAHRIDAIHHCAAKVSWLLPYRHLRDVNVGGLIHILRLACTGPTKPVHYVSSLGTAFMRPFEQRDMVDWVTRASGLGTESILELPLGYLESKWVDLHIVAEARRRGVPVSLYAPGLIGGHAETGVDSLAESQFLHALIQGSAQLGGFPDALGWRFVPVDEAARRIVACALHPEARDVDVYLDSTALIDPDDMVDVLRSRGFAVRRLPFAVWRQQVLDLAETHDTTNALFGFTDVVYAFTPLRFAGQRLQMDYYLQNRTLPPGLRAIVGEQRYVDRRLIERLVDYYVRADAMPPRG